MCKYRDIQIKTFPLNTGRLQNLPQGKFSPQGKNYEGKVDKYRDGNIHIFGEFKMSLSMWKHLCVLHQYFED